MLWYGIVWHVMYTFTTDNIITVAIAIAVTVAVAVAVAHTYSMYLFFFTFKIISKYVQHTNEPFTSPDE